MSLVVGLQLPACTPVKDPTPQPACFIDYKPEPELRPQYPTPIECDPRVAAARSPRIQPPVLVGEHANGTLYVIDRLDNGYAWVGVPAGQDLSPRIFVSSGDRLIEHRGSAGFSLAATYEWGFFGASDRASDGSVRGSYRLNRDRDRKHVDPADVEMVLRESEPQRSFDDMVKDGSSTDEAMALLHREQTQLRARSECTINAFETEFLPGGPRLIEYVAQDERGYHVLVTGPSRQFDGYGFKVFYGPPNRVLERPTSPTIGRKRGGGTTTLQFKVDGAPAELYVSSSKRGGEDRKATIFLSDQTLAVTILSKRGAEQELPKEMTYVCHDQVY